MMNGAFKENCKVFYQENKAEIRRIGRNVAIGAGAGLLMFLCGKKKGRTIERQNYLLMNSREDDD